MIRVLMLSDLTREPDRQLISGISKVPLARGKWVFYHVSPAIWSDAGRAEEIVTKAVDLKVDAIVGQWPGINPAIAASCGIPVIIKSEGYTSYGISSACTDHSAVGHAAGRFFRSFGPHNVAFSGFRDKAWSGMRLEGFKEELGLDDCPSILFEDGEKELDRICRWLESLPKPVGIFSCNDLNAGIIIECCQSVGLRIPQDVSVLGVDNDKFVCSITSPSISTIFIDHERLGFEIGTRLVQMRRTRDFSPFAISTGPVELIERESTPQHTVHDPYVRAIQEIMAKRFHEGIRLCDAVADIPLSRRSLEQRFKKETGTTMLQYLLNLKFNRLEDILRTTDISFQDAASEAGFLESENIYRAFRKREGCTPTEYRALRQQENKLP